jgi:hypothetical protein
MKVKELKELLESFCDEEKEIKIDAELDIYLNIEDISINDDEDCYLLKI